MAGVVALPCWTVQSAAGHQPAQSPSASDSVDILERAQDTQRRFERTRRDHLPTTYRSSGRCDIRIGQYCFRFDEDDPAWVPPPEHEHVISGRAELIETLDSAQRLIAGDPWVNTQLVRYLVEDGQLDRTQSVLRRCSVTVQWWCPALSGYVAHQRGEFRAAERAFERALAHMPPEQRCEWLDLSDLVPGNVRGMLRSVECQDRGPLLDTLFWLADPLFIVSGNELRSEHFARQVVSLMYRQARGPDPDRWNPSTHRITLRYGPPRGWQRIRGNPTELRPSLVTHYGTDGAAFFFPDRDGMQQPTEIAEDRWLTDVRTPQSNHDPAYASNGFEDLSAEFALFRRGDSSLLVGRTILSHDSLVTPDSIQFGLTLTEGPNEPLHTATVESADSVGVLSIAGSARRYLVSLEALAKGSRVAGRARHGIDLSRVHGDGLMTSDVLVLSEVDSMPATPDQAILHLRRPGDFQPAERFTLYWEVYGLDSTNTLHTTTISLDKIGKSIFRRVAELTPFASHRPAVHVAWDEGVPARDASYFTRALLVDLPQELSNGRYRLTLTVEDARGQTSQRSLEIRVES